MELPAWSAVTVQVPALTLKETTFPEIVQTAGVVTAKGTALPDAPPVAVRL